MEDVDIAGNLFYIPEQDLRLTVVTSWKKDDDLGKLHSIVARELTIRNGTDMGDLRAGIVRTIPTLTEDGKSNKIELVLPFSKNILFTRLNDNNSVTLVYYREGTLNHKEIFFNEDGTLNYADYAFLLSEEEKSVLNINQSRK